MEIETKDGGRWELAIAGEIDADNCEEFHQRVLGAEHADGPLFLDLSRLTFIDSSGISSLLKIKAELDGRGHGLQLHSPTESVHRVLQITGLLATFGLEPSGA